MKKNKEQHYDKIKSNECNTINTTATVNKTIHKDLLTRKKKKKRLVNTAHQDHDVCDNWRYSLQQNLFERKHKKEQKDSKDYRHHHSNHCIEPEAGDSNKEIVTSSIIGYIEKPFIKCKYVLLDDNSNDHDHAVHSHFYENDRF
eukprot:Pgem_evm1s13424